METGSQSPAEQEWQDILLVVSGPATGGDVETMTQRFVTSPLWSKCYGSLPLDRVEPTEQSRLHLWSQEGMLRECCWEKLLSMMGVCPVRQGDCLLHLDYDPCVMEVVMEQILDWEGLSLYLGVTSAPSPAKMAVMQKMVEESLGPDLGHYKAFF